MTDRCPTCGQEVPVALRTGSIRTVRNEDAEPLQTVRRRDIRNAEDAPLRTGTMGRLRNAMEALREQHPHGMPGSRNWWRHRMGHETGCVMCGGDLPAHIPYGYGSQSKRVSRNRMFCSNACRQRAYRIVKKVKQESKSKED